MLLRSALSHIKLFPKEIQHFLWGCIFLGLGQAFLSVLLNLRLAAEGLSSSHIGLIQGFGSLGLLFFSVPIARISEHMSLRKLLIFATLLMSGCLILLSQSLHLYTLITAAFLMSGAAGIRSVVSGPWFMQKTTERERLHVFSSFYAVEVAASVLGVLLAGAVPLLFTGTEANRLSHSMLLGCILLMLAVLPFSKIIPLPATPRSGRPLHEYFIPRSFIQFNRIVLPSALISFGAGITFPYLNLFLKQRFGFGAEGVGMVFAATNTCMFLGVLMGPSVGHRYGILRTVIISQLVSIPFMILLAFSRLLPLTFVTLMARAALMNLGQPLAKNFQLECVKQEDRSSLNSISMLAGYMAWSMGTLLGGQLIGELGFTVSILITSLIYFLSTLLYWVFWQ